uniref:Uncharacterized protein n=1 Tax=viral metagenome TaxID=1070528 RepID=A0A6M3Y1U6_9ZZZZ
MAERWFKVGELPRGESVYCNEEGEHAKEVDYTYLVEMTPDELKSVVQGEPDCR